MSKNLAAWFPTTTDAGYPQNDHLRVDPAVMQKARDDSGDLIFTEEHLLRYWRVANGRSSSD